MYYLLQSGKKKLDSKWGWWRSLLASGVLGGWWWGVAVTYGGLRDLHHYGWPLLYFCTEFRVSDLPRQQCVFSVSVCRGRLCVSPGQNVLFDECAENKWGMSCHRYVVCACVYKASQEMVTLTYYFLIWYIICQIWDTGNYNCMLVLELLHSFISLAWGRAADEYGATLDTVMQSQTQPHTSEAKIHFYL